MSTDAASRYCADAPMKRHSQQWKNGLAVRRDADPTKSLCEWCNRSIERLHARSCTWFVVQSARGSEP